MIVLFTHKPIKHHNNTPFMENLNPKCDKKTNTISVEGSLCRHIELDQSSQQGNLATCYMKSCNIEPSQATTPKVQQYCVYKLLGCHFH